MTDWLENLKHYALSDDMDYRFTWEDAAIALEEIESLRMVRDDHALEIGRLQEELSLARLQRDAKLSSQAAVDEAAAREIERLRAALERIDVETCDEYAREIAREALDE